MRSARPRSGLSTSTAEPFGLKTRRVLCLIVREAFPHTWTSTYPLLHDAVVDHHFLPRRACPSRLPAVETPRAPLTGPTGMTGAPPSASMLLNENPFGERT